MQFTERIHCASEHIAQDCTLTVEDAAACGGSAAVQIYPPDGGLPDWAVPAPGTTYGQSVWLSGEVCNTGDCDETYDLAFEYDPAVGSHDSGPADGVSTGIILREL